ncbi:hypothetical protein Rs2_41116 [Raphanus sativus]|nr:hypothetical protein Rs2_41116 [Raphanus sativus]
MTPELRGLIAALRQGECHWSTFTSERIRAAYALPPGLNHAAPIPHAEPVRPQRDQKGKVVKRGEPPAEPSDANSDSTPLKRARRTPERRFPQLAVINQSLEYQVRRMLVEKLLPRFSDVIWFWRRCPEISAYQAWSLRSKI